MASTSVKSHWAWRYLPGLNLMAYSFIALLRTRDVVPFDWIPRNVMWGWVFLTFALLIAKAVHSLLTPTPQDEVPADVKARPWALLFSTLMWLMVAFAGAALLVVSARAFVYAQA